MADDVRISVGLPGHPKTKKLKRRLGGDGCWSLIVLFLWVGAERWDGSLSGMTDEDIELAGDWDGDAGEFVTALLEVGFLKGEEGARFVNGWAEHNPYAAGKGARIEKGKRAANARWGKGSNATSMPGACPEHARSMPEHPSSNAGARAKQCPPAPAPAPAPSSTPEGSLQEPGALPPVVGRFEGHDDPRPTAPNPAAPLAIALNGAGFRCTSLTPTVAEAAAEGVTPEHLLQIAAWPDCAGKPASYLIAIARREIAEGRNPTGNGVQHAARKQGSKLSPAEQVQANIIARLNAGGDDWPDEGGAIEGTAVRITG